MLKLTDWRGLFVVLAGLSFLVAAALLLAVPGRMATRRRSAIGERNGGR